MPSVDSSLDTLIKDISLRYLSHELDRFEAIEGRGEVNQVYKVIAGDRTVILRINTPNEYERFLKEKWCADTASRTVSTPRVICVDKTPECAYMLLDYIPGKNGKDIAATSHFWQLMGQDLHKIHRIPVNGFGEKLQDFTTNTRNHWSVYLSENIQALSGNSPIIELRIFDNQEVDRLVRLFESLQNKEFAFGLSHGDYSPANTIVSQDGSVNIIDWGSAEAHIVPHHDFGVILNESLSENSQLFDSFLEGYGLTIEEYDKIKDDVAVLHLLEAIDKLRWALDKAPHRTDYHKQRVKKLFSQLS